MKLFGTVLLSLLLFSSGAGVVPPPHEERFDPDEFLREREDLVFLKELDVAYGKIYQFKERYRGIDVYGGSCTVSTDGSGKILGINDRTIPVKSILSGKKSRKEAESVALSYGGEILSCDEVVYDFQMCYDFKTNAEGGMEIIISAVDGKPMLVAPLSSLATVPIVQKNFFGEEVELPIECEPSENGGYDYYLADEVRNIYCYNLEADTIYMDLYTNSTGIFEDSLAVSVYETAVKAYDFYADERNVGLSWRGINGCNDDIEENFDENGEIPLTILMHYGSEYENANCGYDPQTQSAIMYVGDGRPGGVLYQQGRAADVIAHEYQHAITEFATPQGLVYLNESGAVNESVSDIFGALVEGYPLTDERFWTIGEEAGPQGSDSGLRSMRAPFGSSPVMHMSDELPLCYKSHDHYSSGDDACDNGNVHGNCSVLPHAQYRMWCKMPEYFTRERIGTLWFTTLGALSRRCTFEEFATEMVKAAKYLDFEEEAVDVIYECFFESGLFKEDVPTHTVIYHQDGTILEKITVRDGESAYAPVLPDREVAAGKYCFRGWDKELDNVKEDLSTQPVFDIVLNKYTVKFMNGGKEICSVEVEYGKSATPPGEVPTKAETERCEYEFTGWDSSFDNVTEDRTINALFKEKIKSFPVTFMSEGKVLARMQVEYGKSATPPEEQPSKAETGRYTYTFDGWDKSFDNITAETVITARFKETARTYRVRFMNGDKIEGDGFFPYGTNVPLLELEEGGMAFEGWYLDKALSKRADGLIVTGDVTLYAKWTKKINVGLIAGLSSAGAAVILAAAIVILVKRKR